MIASERKYLALLCTKPQRISFAAILHIPSPQPRNYSPSNYRTLIKPGVAKNGKACSRDISSTRKMVFHI